MEKSYQESIKEGLLDRIVVITGGAGEIGMAVAIRFLKNTKDHVILADHPEKEKIMESFADAYNEKHGGVICDFKLCDVSDHRSVSGVYRFLINHLGNVDILVNAAGIMPQDPKLLSDMSLEELNALAGQLFGVNVNGTLFWSRAVLPKMRENGYGRIVNISSIAGYGASVGQALYGASKAAIRSITASFAHEALKGMEKIPDIRVNAVAPGIIETPMTAHLPKKALERYLKRNPLHRIGTPDEVAFWVFQLASNENTLMNGQTLVLDGGYLDA